MGKFFPTTLSRLKLLKANLGRREQVSCGPTVFNIETTTDCNLRCVTCPRTHRPPEDTLMPLSLFEKIITDARESLEFVNLFGLGEPLLDPHLEARIRLCAGHGVATHVATNATTLDEERAASLMDAGLAAITFTVSTDRPDQYRDLVEGAPFGRVIRNIENFLAVKKRRRASIHTAIQIIRSPKTARTVAAVATRWKRTEGIDALKVIQDEFGYAGRFPEDEDRWAAGARTCFYLWQGPLVINAKGDMYPCRVAALESAPMANARDASPAEFWMSREMTRLRRRHLEGIVCDHLGCADCKAPKPIPVLSHLSYLASAWDARRAGMLLEGLAFAFHWRIQQREIF